MTTQSEPTQAAPRRSGARRHHCPSAVIGRICLRGHLVAYSPLIIGSGLTDLADIDVLRDPATGEPYIPGTTIAGVIRHRFAELFPRKADDMRLFFGDRKGRKPKKKDEKARPPRMSQLYISDARCTGARILVRDGVCIDPVTGTAGEHLKYDYEVIERGARFPFKIEIVLRQASDEPFFKEMAYWIYKKLSEEEIHFGAKTTAGFGRVRLETAAWVHLDAKRPGDAKALLLKEYESEDFAGWKKAFEPLRPQQETFDPYPLGEFRFKGCFRVKNALMVRSFPTEKSTGGTEADTEMFTAADVDRTSKPVLPGPSLKGAFRHHALRIFNTLHPERESRFHELFGWVETRGGDPDGDTKKIKSRVSMEERFIEKPIRKLQMRNRIDRFTGGTIETALFSSKPVWGDADTRVKIFLEGRDIQPWEAGLILLTIKDFWTGYAAVGGEKNVGRGVFGGVNATFDYQGKTVTIRSDKNGTHLILEGSGSAEDFLNGLVDAFVNADFQEGGAHGTT